MEKIEDEDDEDVEFVIKTKINESTKGNVNNDADNKGVQRVILIPRSSVENNRRPLVIPSSSSSEVVHSNTDTALFTTTSVRKTIPIFPVAATTSTIKTTRATTTSSFLPSNSNIASSKVKTSKTTNGIPKVIRLGSSFLLDRIKWTVIANERDKVEDDFEVHVINDEDDVEDDKDDDGDDDDDDDDDDYDHDDDDDDNDYEKEKKEKEKKHKDEGNDENGYDGYDKVQGNHFDNVTRSNVEMSQENVGDLVIQIGDKGGESADPMSMMILPPPSPLVGETAKRDLSLHKGPEPEFVTSSPEYFCADCNKAFTTHFSLQRHNAVQHGILAKNKAHFKCENCTKIFFCKDELNRHMIKKHNCPNAVLHRCHYCGRLFPSQYELARHRVKIHEPKTIPCSMCNKKFSRDFLLKDHEKRNHRTPSMTKCKTCNEMIYRHQMNEHMATEHSQNLQCSICHRVFLKQMFLAMHLNKDHGLNFNCNKCGRADFTSQFEFSQHIC